MLAPKHLPGSTSFGLLLLRITTGVAMIWHGYTKVWDTSEGFDIMKFHFMSWGGDKSPFEPWAQAVAAFGEFGGGIGLILGLFSPLAALGRDRNDGHGGLLSRGHEGARLREPRWDRAGNSQRSTASSASSS